MQYMLFMNETAEQFEARNDPQRSGPYWAAWSNYVDALTEAGILVNGHGLQGPHVATTVRSREGRRVVQDGPFADTKEQLGGYFVIEVDHLDQAIEWAERAPSAECASVEIRPVLPPMTGEPG